MSVPLVSVCIPTHQGRRFLTRTLDSVLAQTHANLEILVSDDASTDGSADLVRELCGDRAVVERHTKPLGAEGNWNAACSMASGRYVKLLCQDDVLLPRCIEIQVAALENHPGASFCWSQRDVISPHDRVILRSRGLRHGPAPITLEEGVREIVRSGTNPFGEPCAVLFTRDAFARTNGFNGKYLIDLRMWVALLEIAPAVFVDGALSRFRISDSSWTSVLHDQQATEMADFASALAREHPGVITGGDLESGRRRARRLQMARSFLIALTTLSRY